MKYIEFDESRPMDLVLLEELPLISILLTTIR